MSDTPEAALRRWLDATTAYEAAVADLAAGRTTWTDGQKAIWRADEAECVTWAQVDRLRLARMEALHQASFEARTKAKQREDGRR